MRSLHIVIGGGSGFIGSALSRSLQEMGHRVTLISRRPGMGRRREEDKRQEERTQKVGAKGVHKAFGGSTEIAVGTSGA
ncbi:MAG: NAD-dependent epimerase/dehydratase family protein [Pseudomonadota bacterium]